MDPKAVEFVFTTSGNSEREKERERGNNGGEGRPVIVVGNVVGKLNYRSRLELYFDLKRYLFLWEGIQEYENNY